MQFPLPTLAIFNSSYFRKRSLQSIRKKSKSTASFPKQWYLPMAQATLKVLQRKCATSHTKLGCISAALHRYDQCTQIQQKEKKTWTKTEEDLLKSSYLQMTLLLFPYRHHSSCLFDWVINLLCFAYAERNTQSWRNLSSVKNHDGPTESLTKPYKWQQYLWQQAIQIWSLELLVKILCKATQFIVSLNI